MLVICTVICSISFIVSFSFYIILSLQKSQECSQSHWRLLLFSCVYLVLSVLLFTKVLEPTKNCKGWVKEYGIINNYDKRSLDSY